MTMSSKQTISETVNPAGEPKVHITHPKPAEPYTRNTFMRDLKKVTRSKDERSGSGS